MSKIRCSYRFINPLTGIDLVTALKTRFHFSCNSESIPTELCRTQHALDGGIYISTYDGSLLKHQHQKSCSVCLLKSNNSPMMYFTTSKISNSVIAYLNLSITDVVNIYDSADAEIVSVKFIRSPDNLNLESQYLLKSILQKDLLDYSISLSATLVYSIKVKLNSRKFITHQKSSQNRVSNCVFRCDWSSICLTNASLLCNNKIDCLYGDDENKLICKIFQQSNNTYEDGFKNKNKVNSKLLEDISQNKEKFPLILSVVLLSIVLICAGTTIIVCFNVKNKHSNSTKKQANHEFTNFSYDDPSFSSMYLNKSHSKNITGPITKDKLLMEFPQNNNHSNKCNSSIHQVMIDAERKNKLIEPNRLARESDLGKWNAKCPMIKSFDLCPQVSYPDPVTKSSWLRSYFQMTKIKNQMCVKAPLVVNISKFSPVFFSCNN